MPSRAHGCEQPGRSSGAATGTISSCRRSAPRPYSDKPSQQDHSRNRVPRLCQTGSRQVVVHEAPEPESETAAAVRHSLFQVQVDGLFVEPSGVLEYHRTDRRPRVRHSGSFWSILRGTRNESSVDVQLGSAADRCSNGGNVHTLHGPLVVGALHQRRRTQQFQRTVDGVRGTALPTRSLPTCEDRSRRLLHASICAFQGCESSLASLFQFLLGGLSLGVIQ